MSIENKVRSPQRERRIAMPFVWLPVHTACVLAEDRELGVRTSDGLVQGMFFYWYDPASGNIFKKIWQRN